MKRTSRELKRIARDMLNDRYAVPIGAFLTASLIPAVIEIPFSMSMGTYPSAMQLVITGIANFLILLISLVLSIGVMRLHLNMTRKKEFPLSRIFDPFRFGAERYFGAAFLFALLALFLCAPSIAACLYFNFTGITTTSVTLLISSFVLSAVFVTVFILNYLLVFPLLLDHPQMNVGTAFKESKRRMRGNRIRLLGILFSFLGLGMLIACSFGIAALWACPYMMQVLVTFYLECTGELDQIPLRDYNTPSKPFSNPFF